MAEIAAVLALFVAVLDFVTERKVVYQRNEVASPGPNPSSPQEPSVYDVPPSAPLVEPLVTLDLASSIDVGVDGLRVAADVDVEVAALLEVTTSVAVDLIETPSAT